MSDMSREQKKRQLRSRVITPGKPQNQIPQEDREEESQQVHHKVKRRRLILLALLFILLSGLAASFYWYQRYYQYESMSIGWERQLDRKAILQLMRNLAAIYSDTQKTELLILMQKERMCGSRVTK